jgi:DNA polymerase III epsilon subunit-like protein
MKTKQEMTQDRDDAISFLRQVLAEVYFVFDTETTGKDKNYDQIVQWGILTYTGKQSKSLSKATIPVSEGAYGIHHISDIDLENAPNIYNSGVMDKILYGKYVVCYNIEFDARVLKNSLRASGSGLEIDIDNDKIFKPCDVMRLCAAFRGEWSEKYNDYRWRKLDFVCEEFGIEIDLPLHDAMSDAIMTEQVMKYIASQKLSTE